MNDTLQILVAGIALVIAGGGSIHLFLTAVERACDWLARQAGRKNRHRNQYDRHHRAAGEGSNHRTKGGDAEGIYW